MAVAGHSMAPTLREGDWLLYVRLGRAPRAGDVVVARDPREPERWLIKRVRGVEGDAISLAGDVPGHDAGPVRRDAIMGRAVLRYWPLRRVGPL